MSNVHRLSASRSSRAASAGSPDLKAIKIYRGVSIYKVRGSQFWYVRVWDRDKKRYIVKGTGETSVIAAREVARDYALSLLKNERTVEREFTFRHFAIKCLSKNYGLAEGGDRNIGYVKAIRWSIQNADWGLLKWFGNKDVRKITTRDFRDYMEHLSKRRSDLSSSTKNTIMAAFRNVLKAAREEGAIDIIPDTPRAMQRDNPRPFFRFYPLVSKEDDVYTKVLATAKEMAQQGVVIRGVPVTDELRDIILFLTHSFVRPIVSELYSIRHNDITVAEDPARLIVVVRDGKTGFRSANTMSPAVAVYERIRKRYADSKGEDYIFLPQYSNRQTASKIIQRQFKELMKRAGVEDDPITGMKHSIYSLRHTAICMRIVLSEGQVNIFNLAKNAGTSVDQIERFYARRLPLSAELAKNLHTFGNEEHRDWYSQFYYIPHRRGFAEFWRGHLERLRVPRLPAPTPAQDDG
jgi:site-specific recombinase XerD